MIFYLVRTTNSYRAILNLEVRCTENAGRALYREEKAEVHVDGIDFVDFDSTYGSSRDT